MMNKQNIENNLLKMIRKTKKKNFAVIKVKMRAFANVMAAVLEVMNKYVENHEVAKNRILWLLKCDC